MKSFSKITATLFVLALLASVFSSAGAAPLPRLRVSDNGHYFVKQDGSPFLYLGDTAWGLFRMTHEDIDLYLKDRVGKKFTVIQAVAVGMGGSRPNAYGQTAFIDNDAHLPNDAYFQQVDYAVNKAETLGLYVGMVAIWSKEFITAEKSVLDKTSAYNYGKYLGSRYRDKPIIWILGGDWFADGVEDIWRSLAAGLKAGDGGTHLITYHPKSPRSSSQWFQKDAWLSFNMLQSGHTRLNRNYDLVTEDWARTPVKPVVDGEGGYEGIDNAIEGKGTIEAADVRRIAYGALFAGAAGYTYGGHGVWGYSSPTGQRAGTPATPPKGAVKRAPSAPFPKALQLEGATEMQHLRALLESRPMLVRIPDQWLIANDYMGTVDRIQACRASDGSYALIYTATGANLKIRVVDNLYQKVTGKTIKAWWYDPRQGTSRAIGELPKKGAFMDFTPPSSGRGNDWVLVIDDASKNFPAPGTK
jgi:hypothetical protein